MCIRDRSGDMILIAGKGHENYQEIRGICYPMNDKELVSCLLYTSKHLSSRRKRKQHVILEVAASETGRAQTSVRACWGSDRIID